MRIKINDILSQNESPKEDQTKEKKIKNDQYSELCRELLILIGKDQSEEKFTELFLKISTDKQIFYEYFDQKEQLEILNEIDQIFETFCSRFEETKQLEQKEENLILQLLEAIINLMKNDKEARNQFSSQNHFAHYFRSVDRVLHFALHLDNIQVIIQSMYLIFHLLAHQHSVHLPKHQENQLRNLVANYSSLLRRTPKKKPKIQSFLVSDPCYDNFERSSLLMQNRRKKTSLEIRNISTYTEQENQGQGQQDFEYEINPSELHKYDEQTQDQIELKLETVRISQAQEEQFRGSSYKLALQVLPQDESLRKTLLGTLWFDNFLWSLKIWRLEQAFQKLPENSLETGYQVLQASVISLSMLLGIQSYFPQPRKFYDTDSEIQEAQKLLIELLSLRLNLLTKTSIISCIFAILSAKQGENQVFSDVILRLLQDLGSVEIIAPPQTEMEIEGAQPPLIQISGANGLINYAQDDKRFGRLIKHFFRNLKLFTQQYIISQNREDFLTIFFHIFEEQPVEIATTKRGYFKYPLVVYGQVMQIIDQMFPKNQRDTNLTDRVVKQVEAQMEIYTRALRGELTYFKWNGKSEKWEEVRLNDLLALVKQGVRMLMGLFPEQRQRRERNLMNAVGPAVARKLEESRIFSLLRQILPAPPGEELEIERAGRSAPDVHQELLALVLQLVVYSIHELPGVVLKSTLESGFAENLVALIRASREKTLELSLRVVEFIQAVSLTAEGKDFIDRFDLIDGLFLVFRQPSEGTPTETRPSKNSLLSRFTRALLEYLRGASQPVRQRVVDCVAGNFRLLLDQERVIMEQIESQLEHESDGQPVFRSELLFQFTSQTQVFFRFFQEIVSSSLRRQHYNDEYSHQSNHHSFIKLLIENRCLELFLQLNQSPILSLYEPNRQNWIKDVCDQMLQIREIGEVHKALAQAVEKGFQDFKNDLGCDLKDVRDLSTYVCDEICYEARISEDMLNLLGKRDRNLMKPLRIVARMNYLKNLLHASCENFYLTPDLRPLAARIMDLYLLNINQFKREDVFYFRQLYQQYQTEEAQLSEEERAAGAVTHAQEEALSNLQEILEFKRQDIRQVHEIIKSTLNIRRIHEMGLTRLFHKNVNIRDLQEVYVFLIRRLLEDVDLAPALSDSSLRDPATMEVLLKNYYNIVLVVDLLETYNFQVLEAENYRRTQQSRIKKGQQKTDTIYQVCWNMNFFSMLYSSGSFQRISDFLDGLLALFEGLDAEVCSDARFEELSFLQSMSQRIVNCLCNEGIFLFDLLFLNPVDISEDPEQQPSGRSAQRPVTTDGAMHRRLNWMVLDQLKHLKKFIAQIDRLPKKSQSNQIFRGFFDKIFQKVNELIKSGEGNTFQDDNKGFSQYSILSSIATSSFSLSQPVREELQKEVALGSVSVRELKAQYWRDVVSIGDQLLRNLFRYENYEYMVAEIKVDIEEQVSDQKDRDNVLNQRYNDLAYIVLQVIRGMINRVFSGFKFRFNSIRGTRQLYQRIMQREFIDIPETTDPIEITNQMNYLMPVLIRLSERSMLFQSDIGFQFIKLASLIIKNAEKLALQDVQSTEIESQEKQMGVLQLFLQRILMFIYQVLIIEEMNLADFRTRPEEKARAKFFRQYSKFQDRVTQFVGDLLLSNNNIYQKMGKNVITPELLQALFSILIKVADSNSEYLRKFVKAQGFTELLKMRDIPDAGLLKLLTRLVLISLGGPDSKTALLEAHYKQLIHELNTLHREKQLQQEKERQEKERQAKEKQAKEEKAEQKDDQQPVAERGGGEMQIEQAAEKAEEQPLTYQMEIFASRYKSLVDSGLLDADEKVNQALLEKLFVVEGKQGTLRPEVVLTRVQFAVSHPPFNYESAGSGQPGGVPEKRKKHSHQEKPKNSNDRMEEEKPAQPQFGLYLPDETSQVLIYTLLESIVSQFNLSLVRQVQKEEKEGQQQRQPVFSFTLLLNCLHILIRHNPLLIPMIAKYRCKSLLKKQLSGQNAYLDAMLARCFREGSSNFSFLNYLTKIVTLFCGDRFSNLVFEMCLDNLVLIQNKQGQTVFYSQDLRKRILYDIFQSLEQEAQSKAGNLLERYDMIHKVIVYTTLHSQLLSLKEISKLSYKIEESQQQATQQQPQQQQPAPQSLNFIKLYTELLKNFDLKKYYSLESVIQHLIQILNVLYQQQFYHIFQQKHPHPQDAKQLLQQGSIELVNRQIMPLNSMVREQFGDLWIKYLRKFGMKYHKKVENEDFEDHDDQFQIDVDLNPSEHNMEDSLTDMEQDEYMDGDVYSRSGNNEIEQIRQIGFQEEPSNSWNEEDDDDDDEEDDEDDEESSEEDEGEQAEEDQHEDDQEDYGIFGQQNNTGFPNNATIINLDNNNQFLLLPNENGNETETSSTLISNSPISQILTHNDDSQSSGFQDQVSSSQQSGNPESALEEEDEEVQDEEIDDEDDLEDEDEEDGFNEIIIDEEDVSELDFDGVEEDGIRIENLLGRLMRIRSEKFDSEDEKELGIRCKYKDIIELKGIAIPEELFKIQKLFSSNIGEIWGSSRRQTKSAQQLQHQYDNPALVKYFDKQGESGFLRERLELIYLEVMGVEVMMLEARSLNSWRNVNHRFSNKSARHYGSAFVSQDRRSENQLGGYFEIEARDERMEFNRFLQLEELRRNSSQDPSMNNRVRAALFEHRNSFLDSLGLRGLVQGQDHAFLTHNFQDMMDLDEELYLAQGARHQLHEQRLEEDQVQQQNMQQPQEQPQEQSQQRVNRLQAQTQHIQQMQNIRQALQQMTQVQLEQNEPGQNRQQQVLGSGQNPASQQLQGGQLSQEGSNAQGEAASSRVSGNNPPGSQGQNEFSNLLGIIRDGITQFERSGIFRNISGRPQGESSEQVIQQTQSLPAQSTQSGQQVPQQQPSQQQEQSTQSVEQPQSGVQQSRAESQVPQSSDPQVEQSYQQELLQLNEQASSLIQQFNSSLPQNSADQTSAVVQVSEEVQESQNPTQVENQNADQIQIEDGEEQPGEGVMQQSLQLLREYGCDAGFFERYDIDPLVFDGLPREFQLEIIEQHLPMEQERQNQVNIQNQIIRNNLASQQGNQNNNGSGIDEDFINALPPDLQGEVRQQMQQMNQIQQQQQQQQEQGQQAGNQQQQQQHQQPAGDDNNAFVIGLTQDLRAEILLQCSEEFLQSLNPQLQEEAQRIRGARQRSQREQDEMYVNLLHGGEGAPNRYLQSQQLLERHRQGEAHRQPGQSSASKSNKNLKEIIQKDRSLQQKLQQVDERLVESLLRMLYLDNDAFVKFPYQLIKVMSISPSFDYKILDALFFILKYPELAVFRREQTENCESDFPLVQIYQRNGLTLRSYREVYQNVSLKILYVLYRICGSSLVYFLDNSSEGHSARRQKPSSGSGAGGARQGGLQFLSLSGVQQLRQRLEQGSVKPITGGQSQNAFIDCVRFLMNEEFYESSAHLNFLVQIISTIVTRFFGAQLKQSSESGSAEDNEEQRQKFRLDQTSIKCICQVLTSDQLSQETIVKLNDIINHLCFDKENLETFIREFRNIITFLAENINQIVSEGLKELKALRAQGGSNPAAQLEAEVKLIRETEKRITDEQKILKIFLIVKQIFEKSYTESFEKQETAVKKTQQQEKQQNEQQGGQQGEQKQKSQGEIKYHELLENTRNQIRQSFSYLIEEQLLKNTWLSVIEFYSLLAEKHSQTRLKMINDKFSPILESYFIIYRIMFDNEYENEILLKKIKQQQQQKQRKNISALQLEKLGSQQTQENFETLRESEIFDEKQVFGFLARQSKPLINHMLKKKLYEQRQLNTHHLSQHKTPNLSIFKEPIGIVLKVAPNVIDFENKKNIFRTEIQCLKQQSQMRSVSRNINIKVHRNNVFEDSFQRFQDLRGEALRGKLRIDFIDEEGMDAGGLTREWFQILSKEIFNQDYGLFTLSATGNTYQPNKDGLYIHKKVQIMDYFNFIGKVIAKALWDEQLMEAFFTRSFYKHILGQPISYHDIQDQDLILYRSLKQMAENSMEELGLEETWSITVDNFGDHQIIDLIPNGRNIEVKEEDKMEYIQKKCYHLMAESIKIQIESFLEGFHQLIPPQIISIFDSKELELLISGMPEIDIQDLKDNTEYNNYTAQSQVIRWLWEILEQFDKQQKAAFIQFVTGTSQVPIDGFKALRGMNGPTKFSIHKAYQVNKLPTAHTCYNQLDLPDYPTKDMLIEKLMLAITEGKEGFGFV